MNIVKQKRISAEIQRCLTEIILEESHDSILKNLTITACEVTNDLSYCRVFVTTMDNVDHKALLKELNDDTASYLRTKLANMINIRHTPKLLFKYDDSIAYGNNIDKIIAKLHAGE